MDQGIIKGTTRPQPGRKVAVDNIDQDILPALRDALAAVATGGRGIGGVGGCVGMAAPPVREGVTGAARAVNRAGGTGREAAGGRTGRRTWPVWGTGGGEAG